MGSYDGAEICGVVRLLLLHQMREELPIINFGLYRVNCLGFSSDIAGPQIDKIKKDIIQLYLRHDLKITINLH